LIGTKIFSSDFIHIKIICDHKLEKKTITFDSLELRDQTGLQMNQIKGNYIFLKSIIHKLNNKKTEKTFFNQFKIKF